jgi:hypothetical protein
MGQDGHDVTVSRTPGELNHWCEVYFFPALTIAQRAL